MNAIRLQQPFLPSIKLEDHKEQVEDRVFPNDTSNHPYEVHVFNVESETNNTTKNQFIEIKDSLEETAEKNNGDIEKNIKGIEKDISQNITTTKIITKKNLTSEINVTNSSDKIKNTNILDLSIKNQTIFVDIKIANQSTLTTTSTFKPFEIEEEDEALSSSQKTLSDQSTVPSNAPFMELKDEKESSSASIILTTAMPNSSTESNFSDTDTTQSLLSKQLYNE